MCINYHCNTSDAQDRWGWNVESFRIFQYKRHDHIEFTDILNNETLEFFKNDPVYRKREDQE
jgi:hypothetical protein